MKITTMMSFGMPFGEFPEIHGAPEPILAP